MGRFNAYEELEQERTDLWLRAERAERENEILREKSRVQEARLERTRRYLRELDNRLMVVSPDMTGAPGTLGWVRSAVLRLLRKLTETEEW